MATSVPRMMDSGTPLSLLSFCGKKTFLDPFSLTQSYNLLLFNQNLN